MKLLIDSDEFLFMLGRQDRIADYAQNVAEQLFRPLYDNDEARQMYGNGTGSSEDGLQSRGHRAPPT